MTRITKLHRKTYIATTQAPALPTIENQNGKINKKHRFRTNNEKQENKLSKDEIAKLKRRTRRQRKKEHNMECFLCRTKGHSIKSCPKNKENVDICYRCGSLEHLLSQCSKQFDSKNPLPFAFCFQCNQKGHIIGQCLLNENGLYPDGGCCDHCGSVRHLKKDCKPLEQDTQDVTVGVVDLSQVSFHVENHVLKGCKA